MTFIIGTPHTKNAGYLRNDDTPSGGKLHQADVQTCWHCQKVLDMQRHAADGAICRGCAKPICDPCALRALTDGCVPFTKLIEMAMEKAERRAQYRKLIGV